MSWIRITIVVLLGLAATSAPAEERVVSLRREVIPILTKHGCATGACHGSPSGKGGFRLSLRGFDTEVDQVTLIREAFGRRVNLADPRNSLLLRKPLMEITHGGGRKLRPTDPGHQILRNWISQGCQIDLPAGSRCLELVVAPYTRIRQWPDVQFQLQITARFDDGMERDVTQLADFASTEESVATINASGEVHGVDRGEATLIVRYLDQLAVAPVTILRPEDGFVWSDPPANNKIDEFLFAKQKQLQILPSDLCTDGEFIRRLYLDVLGILPTLEETRSFLADTTLTKRATLIDRVLERDEYAEFWALKWGDLLQLKASKLSPDGVAKFHEWLVRTLRNNLPYDRFAAELLTATGSTFENPPANFFRAAADVDTCSESTSQLFLGIRIQCAKCHNHPYERWTQDNYYGLGAFFRRVQRRPDRATDELTIWVANTGEVTQPRTGQVIQPLVPIDGFIDIPVGTDRREIFVKWLIKPTNPFFAKVGVNRIWGHIMGRGLVDPVDDFRESNPASHPELLDWLAGEFAGTNLSTVEASIVTKKSTNANVDPAFDQKRILRLILNSRTYQLSSRANRFNERDSRLFSHAIARPLTAEPLLDAVCSMTDVAEKFAGLPTGTRATQLPSPDVGNDFLKVFGQPARNTVCDCERSREPKLSQTLQLLNGDFIQNKVVNRQSRLSRYLNRSRGQNDVVFDPPTQNLQIWLRADVGISNAKGSVAIDGDTVATWSDQGPHGRTVVQSDSARRPTFVQHGIRQRPALRFDGDDFLCNVTTNLVAESAARTVLIVAQAGENSVGGSVLTFRRSAPVCTMSHVVLGNVYYVYSDGVNVSGNSTIPMAIDAIRQPFVTAFASPGAGQKLMVWLNGVRQSVTQPGAIGTEAGAAGFTVGNREDYPGLGWNGLISEVLVFDRLLTDLELAELSRQLELRYGVESSASALVVAPTPESERLDRAFVSELYLSAFSREPASDELDAAMRHLQLLNDRREGLGDIMWALLNSKEFLFQH